MNKMGANRNQPHRRREHDRRRTKTTTQIESQRADQWTTEAWPRQKMMRSQKTLVAPPSSSSTSLRHAVLSRLYLKYFDFQ
jgi:hypothetical protein